MKTQLFLLSALLVLGACATYIPSEVKNTISSYEAICLGKGQHAKTTPKQPDNSFNIIPVSKNGVGKAKTVKYNGLAMKVVL